MTQNLALMLSITKLKIPILIVFILSLLTIGGAFLVKYINKRRGKGNE